MRLPEIIRIIRAVRENDSRPATVTIEKLSSGNVVCAVKVSGRDVRAVARRARETFDDLVKRYGGKP